MHTIQLPADIYSDLEHINAIIAERIRFRPEVERIAAPHTIHPASERLHAALVLMCASVGDYSLERSAHAAAAVEFIQAASSLHNALVAELADSHATTNSKPSWRGNVDLMVGDYLYALAAAEMALTPDQRIIAYFSESVMAISEGEMAPVQIVTPLSHALEQYDYTIGRQIATLCEAACKAGAICGELDIELVKLLGSYGYALGMAHAIVRDVQQLRTAEVNSRFSLTLPLIYAADESYPLTQLLSSASLSAEQRTAVMTAALTLGGDTRALADAQMHIERACALLEGLPPGPARAALMALAQSMLRQVEASPARIRSGGSPAG